MTVEIGAGPRGDRLAERFANPLVGGLVIAVALAVTAAAWYGSRQAVQDRAEQRFEFEAQELKSAINDRMIGYEQVLRGGVGLFYASDDVSRGEWRDYVDTVNIEQHWPGLQGLGFALPVEPDQLDAHVAEIRAEGFPDYGVRPEEPRDEYTAIVYLEPFDERNQRAFGFDMWSNEIRREAMTRARDTGEAATSGAITLVQETDDDIQRGFLTYVPVYADGRIPATAEERRDSLQGWVYAAFRAGDLMNGIVGPETAGVGYEIFSGGEPVVDALLFDSDDDFRGPVKADDDFISIDQMDLQGQEWTIVFHSGPDFISSAEALQPTLIAIAGLAINGLIFYVLASMGYLQRRATSLAQTMTTELQATQRDLEARSRQLQVTADQLQYSNNALETTNSALQTSNAELEKTNADLEQFLFTAAHDLQAPLRTISSYAMLFEDTTTGVSDDGRTYLDRITGSANRMSELLTDLLTYARIGWDREPQPVDLADLASTVVDDIVADEHVRVSIEALPVVPGHEAHLRLLLQNLVDNATKFAKDDEPVHITISAEERDSSVVVSVTDTGIGFDPDHSEQIFSVFQRLGQSEDMSGTGIGLAHCRKIARMHHGEAWATSTPGVGSTFSFSLATHPDRTPATIGA